MTSEIDRLTHDLQNAESLREEAKTLGTDPGSMVAWASERGYDFSLEELIAHNEAQRSELTEEELGKVAGGVGALAWYRSDALRHERAPASVGEPGTTEITRRARRPRTR